MKPSMTIILALIACLSTLPIRIIISRAPFHIKNTGVQIISSTVFGMILWVASILFIGSASVAPDTIWGDVLCGGLIFLSVSWCNYWSGNLAGGFRIQMLLSLTDQKHLLSLEEWMMTFGGLGMEAFLRDRIKAILIPWNTVSEENGELQLLPGWGVFFGKLMVLLGRIMPKVRGS